MEPTPDILRAAMVAYVNTFPSKERLAAHLEQHRLDDQFSIISKHLDACLSFAYDFLYDYPGGATWTPVFRQELTAALRDRHPWLEGEALDRVLSYSQWIAWHDGLNAPEPR